MGQFFSLFIYSFFIFGPLQELGNVINVYRETEASLANFQAILAIPKEPRPLHPVSIGPLTSLAFELSCSSTQIRCATCAQRDLVRGVAR